MLGKRGFGNVYKGLLANSNEKFVVKRFKGGSNQGEKEYIYEINVISTLRHKNLVQLKGWCHENEELLLVYEFLPNRSLDFHLFGNNVNLTLPTRYNIAVDLANALHYLQDGCDPFVLHRESIKSSNIMLDSNFNAKLRDFGLARLTQQDQNFRTTAPAGTLGYLAPEVISSGKVSKASGTFSYGVVALELVSGKRPVNRSKELNLVEWVWELYGEGSVLEAKD
nr:receptor kinase S.5 [Fagopyrum tataricum]